MNTIKAYLNFFYKLLTEVIYNNKLKTTKYINIFNLSIILYNLFIYYKFKKCIENLK